MPRNGTYHIFAPAFNRAFRKQFALAVAGEELHRHDLRQAPGHAAVERHFAAVRLPPPAGVGVPGEPDSPGARTVTK